MGIIKTGKIQSHGDIVGLTTRIAALEDKYVKALWYAEISAGTSGTITPPTNGTIVLNEFGNDVDAVTSTITTGKKPDFVSAKTAAGAIVTATLAANGNWTISGAPSAYPIALVYVYEVKLVNFDHDSSLYEEEISQGVQVSDSPIFVGLTLSGLTASLPVVTDANKALASLAYTGATSLRNNLGLEPSYTPSFSSLDLNRATGNMLTTYYINGTPKAYMGTSDTSDAVIVGLVSGDLAIRSQNGNVLFSTNAGNSILLRLTSDQNVGIGLASFGTSAAKVLGMGSGTAPSTSPADAAQMWVADQAAGNACFNMRTENGAVLTLYRVVDARIDDTINSGDATTDGVIDAMRDALIALGFMAAA